MPNLVATEIAEILFVKPSDVRPGDVRLEDHERIEQSFESIRDDIAEARKELAAHEVTLKMWENNLDASCATAERTVCVRRKMRAIVEAKV